MVRASEARTAGSKGSSTGEIQTNPTSSFRHAAHQRPQRIEAGRRGNKRQTIQTRPMKTAP